MTPLDDSVLKRQLKAIVQQDPVGGSLQLMDLILEIFNLHPETQPESFIDSAWLEKSQSLLAALNYFLTMGVSSAKLKQDLADHTLRVDQTTRNLADSRTRMKELQAELESSLQQKIQADRVLEQLQAVESVINAQPEVQQQWLRLHDDERLQLTNCKLELETLLGSAHQNMLRAEELIRGIALKFDADIESLQKENGR